MPVAAPIDFNALPIPQGYRPGIDRGDFGFESGVSVTHQSAQEDHLQLAEGDCQFDRLDNILNSKRNKHRSPIQITSGNSSLLSLQQGLEEARCDLKSLSLNDWSRVNDVTGYVRRNRVGSGSGSGHVAAMPASLLAVELGCDLPTGPDSLTAILALVERSNDVTQMAPPPSLPSRPALEAATHATPLDVEAWQRLIDFDMEVGTHDQVKTDLRKAVEALAESQPRPAARLMVQLSDMLPPASAAEYLAQPITSTVWTAAAEARSIIARRDGGTVSELQTLEESLTERADVPVLWLHMVEIAPQSRQSQILARALESTACCDVTGELMQALAATAILISCKDTELQRRITSPDHHSLFQTPLALAARASLMSPDTPVAECVRLAAVVAEFWGSWIQQDAASYAPGASRAPGDADTAAGLELAQNWLSMASRLEKGGFCEFSVPVKVPENPLKLSCEVLGCAAGILMAQSLSRPDLEALYSGESEYSPRVAGFGAGLVATDSERALPLPVVRRCTIVYAHAYGPGRALSFLQSLPDAIRMQCTLVALAMAPEVAMDPAWQTGVTPREIAARVDALVTTGTVTALAPLLPRCIDAEYPLLLTRAFGLMLILRDQREQLGPQEVQLYTVAQGSLSHVLSSSMTKANQAGELSCAALMAAIVSIPQSLPALARLGGRQQSVVPACDITGRSMFTARELQALCFAASMASSTPKALALGDLPDRALSAAIVALSGTQFAAAWSSLISGDKPLSEAVLRCLEGRRPHQPVAAPNAPLDVSQASMLSMIELCFFHARTGATDACQAQAVSALQATDDPAALWLLYSALALCGAAGQLLRDRCLEKVAALEQRWRAGEELQFSAIWRERLLLNPRLCLSAGSWSDELTHPTTLQELVLDRDLLTGTKLKSP